MTGRTWSGAAALIMALGAGASGGGSVSTDPARADRTAGSTADQAADLTITVDDSGTVTTWHLTCGPAGGDHPDPARACAVLAEAGARALPPVPRDMMCTQNYGGPETARIVGTWAGRPVDARFSKRNGCEIGRWRALTGLLP
jgi:hypothetical protein